MFFFRIKAYVSHFIKAKNQYSIHSPFVYNWYMQVVKNGIEVVDMRAVEKLRSQLHRNATMIDVNDFGTGKNSKPSRRKIADIARNYAGSAKDASLLSRCITFSKPETILELGTSLGLTTLYLAKAAANANIYTLEGCPQTAKLAQDNFARAEVKVSLLVGDIGLQLPLLVNQLSGDAMVLFDANHTKQATLAYYQICKPLITENSVFIFDDIYWSKEMSEAWQEIIAQPEVSVSIDLYHKGIVFFRKTSAKQHFVLKY